MSNLALPKDWESSTLGDVADIVSGMGFPKHLQGKIEGELPVFKVGDISSVWKDGQTTLVKSPNNLSKEEAAEIKGKIHPQGTIVFAKIGEALRLNRRAILGQLSLVDNNVMGLVPRAQVVDGKYLFYFMTTVDLGDLSRATAVPSIRKSDVQNIKFPLAPLEQQKRIVAEIEKQFSRLDEAVANLKRVKANLKRYKAAVLKAAVEGKLTEEWRKQHPDIEPADKLLERILAERREKWQGRGKYKEPVAPDTTDLPELPEGWVWASAEQLCEFITKGTTPKAPKLHNGEGDIRFLKVYNLTFSGDLNYNYKPVFVDNEVHQNELSRSKVFSGDVLINIVGPPLGQVSVVPPEITEANINQAIARFRPLNGVLYKFVASTLMSISVMSWATKRAKTTAGQSNLTLALCRELPIPLAPTAEQEQVIEEVERFLSVISKAENQIEKNLHRADRLRQSILKKAFSGKLIFNAGTATPQVPPQVRKSKAEK